MLANAIACTLVCAASPAMMDVILLLTAMIWSRWLSVRLSTPCSSLLCTQTVHTTHENRAWARLVSGFGSMCSMTLSMSLSRKDPHQQER
jgi:hypothetical protein